MWDIRGIYVGYIWDIYELIICQIGITSGVNMRGGDEIGM